ncbi:MAG: hypothetical protein ACI4IF_04320 [Acutalibacteraceae bacterium]
MNKTLGKIILAVIILSQFVVSFGMSGIERYRINQLEEKGKEVKILVDTVEYCDNRVWCYCDGFYDDAEYMELYETDNGYYKFASSSKKPEIDTYITPFYFNSTGIYYEVDEVLDDGNYTVLYNKENEIENIKHGNSEGPQTQAELVMKVHKGCYKIENIYIDGMTVKEVMEKAANGVYDLERYFYYYYSDDYYSDEDYDGNLDESLTETVEEDE